jgi:hypothetical protein
VDGGALAAAAAAAPKRSNKVATKPASDVFAGALARALSQSTIHPLDTLKVRMQAAGNAATSAAMSGGAAAARAAPAAASVRGLSKFGQLVPPPVHGPDFKAMSAGLASLYKGVVGAASGAGIAIGAYFACYGVACNVIATHTDLSPSAVAFVSGGVAAAGSSVVKVPLAVCIRSVQAGVYPNVFAAASSITSKAGVRGLFTGFFPTLLEDVPDMAVKFAAYESLRQLHKRANNGRNPSPQVCGACFPLSDMCAPSCCNVFCMHQTLCNSDLGSTTFLLRAAILLSTLPGPCYGAALQAVAETCASNHFNLLSSTLHTFIRVLCCDSPEYVLSFLLSCCRRTLAWAPLQEHWLPRLPRRWTSSRRA